jgi:hypothetical protein
VDTAAGGKWAVGTCLIRARATSSGTAAAVPSSRRSGRAERQSPSRRAVSGLRRRGCIGVAGDRPCVQLKFTTIWLLVKSKPFVPLRIRRSAGD